MCKEIVIYFCLLAAFPTGFLRGQPDSGLIAIHIFSEKLIIPIPDNFKVDFNADLSHKSIFKFHKQISASDFAGLISRLVKYKKEKHLNDWFYYQLVRRTAQAIAPKEENYNRYTLYKWFLMVKSGFDAKLAIHNNQLLFYVLSSDEVFSIPLFESNGKQYVCLNIHDYFRGNTHFSAYIDLVNIEEPEATAPFSYSITRLPEFDQNFYIKRQVNFYYGNQEYAFDLKLNPQIQQLYTNYPIMDFGTYFNIPVSQTTYQSLIGPLKRELKGLSAKNGVDYLMKFTRYAFLYEDDQGQFGKEKRMGPEEALMSNSSDCDDRVALFFFLVKEIYNLPMIVMLYSDHVTIAVQFKKGYGKTITHNGNKYSVCEPTPQVHDLSIGQLSPKLRNKPFEVVYAYQPQ